MSNKRIKAVLDNFNLAKTELKSRLSGLQNSNHMHDDAGNLARTIDHQVTELANIRGVASDEKITEATRLAQKRFAKLSKILRECANNGMSNWLEADGVLNEGYKALGQVELLVHKKDDVHEKHHHAPKIKYKPKEHKENAEAAKSA